MTRHIDSANELGTRSATVLYGARISRDNENADQCRRASLFVAGSATDVEDCALLLDMLGLIAPRTTATS